MNMQEEGFVFPKTEWVKTRMKNISNVRIYKQDFISNKEFDYIEGHDYKIDYVNGRICRTENSLIPDFVNSCFYGIKPFDHDLFPSYGNGDFLIYASYDYSCGDSPEVIAEKISKESNQYAVLRGKLKLIKKHLIIKIYGDSISTGLEASTKNKAYFYRFAQYISKFYGIEVEIINTAVNGYTSKNGRDYYDMDNNNNYDWMIIAFGMNDQNCWGDKLPITPQIYENNIRYLCNNEIAKGKLPILVSPCIPHPNWIHNSGRMAEYVSVLDKISKELKIPFADVNSLFRNELEIKPFDCLLRNGINHPNNYGHYLYSLMLKNLL